MSKATSRFIAALLLCVVFAGVSASAKKLTRLYLYMVDKRYSVGQPSATGDAFDDEIDYTLRSDEAAEVWVHDWNPLVWAYATSLKSEKTADYEAAEAFGKVVSELLLRFAGSKGSGTPPMLVDGLDLMAFRDAVITLQHDVDSIDDWIDQSLNPDDVTNMQTEVRKVPALADTVDDGYAKAVRIFIKCLQGRPLSAQNGTPVSCDDPYDAAEARVNATASGQTIRLFLTAVLSMESHVMNSERILRGFARDATDVGPHKIDTRPYSQEKQTLTLTVTAEEKYQAFMSKSAKMKQKEGLRKVAVIVEPYRPVFVRPGVAFILGLLKNPTYATAKSGDQFKIVETGTGLARYNVAAMLNIIPRRWNEPTFGGFFQIGVSPKSDETGFYLGGGIQVEKVFTFGGGVMLQQVRRLGGGLTPDSRLATPEDLRVEHPFKKALYLHATVALPGGK